MNPNLKDSLFYEYNGNKKRIKKAIIDEKKFSDFLKFYDPKNNMFSYYDEYVESDECGEADGLEDCEYDGLKDCEADECDEYEDDWEDCDDEDECDEDDESNEIKLLKKLSEKISEIDNILKEMLQNC
jgi:hypothetical protein